MLATGIYFVKHMPQSEVLFRLTRLGDARLLWMLLDRAARERCNSFSIGKVERVTIGIELGMTEGSVANALSRLSKPREEGGLELLTREGKGRYALNPVYYFVGDQRSHERAIERHATRRMERVERSRAKAKADAATKVAAEAARPSLRIVS